MRSFLAILVLLMSQLTFAQSKLKYEPKKFAPWLKTQQEFSTQKLIESMSFSDLAPGALVASPSRQNPDYYYHWTRDAALVMDVVVSLYEKSTDPIEKVQYQQKIKNYIQFSIQNQKSDALTGLGEPKFYVDGTPFSLSWGRPQNDGPALRALTLIRYANLLQNTSQKQDIEQLYRAEMPAHSLIKKDLEYVSHHWREASFDLWEEHLASHFYTLYVQRASLIKGAELAQKLNDPGASDWYLRQAHQIENVLKQFINQSKPYILTSLHHNGGLDSKKSNLDVATLLGVLHGKTNGSLLTWGDDKITGTVQALQSEFHKIYKINHDTQFPGTGIGRYPEDVYDGNGFSGGNPWFLTTLAVAEVLYNQAIYFAELNPYRQLGNPYFQKAEEYMQRVFVHADRNGHMSEQFDKTSGYMTGARDLTWSYAAFLTASWARERALAATYK